MIQKINTRWKIPADQRYRIAKSKARPGTRELARGAFGLIQN
jgi:hypothetical protein